MEQSETVDEEKLDQVARALGTNKEAIKNYTEEVAIFHIANMQGNSSANYQYTFNQQ